MKTPLAHLTDPGAYEAALSVMIARRPDLRLAEDVPIVALGDQSARFCRLLCEEVASGRYRVAPVTLRRAVIQEKERVLWQFSARDLLVQQVVLEATQSPALQRQLYPTHLYSFRRGLSATQAVHDFARWVQAESARAPRGGVFVLRRDIKSYTDEIPVDDASPLWSILGRRLGRDSAPEACWRVFVEQLRPPLAPGSERLLPCPDRSRGLATGAPICNLVANLYLLDLDAQLSAAPGAFLARYGDDLLMAHPDAEVAATLAGTLESGLQGLRLREHPAKRADLYLSRTGAARAGWSGTTAIDLLGRRVVWPGQTQLSPARTRRLLRDVGRRAWRVAALAGDPEDPGQVEARARLAVSALRRMMEAEDALASPSVRAIVAGVTDRAWLEQLDAQIWALVAEAATGVRGRRAQRQCPPHLLRSMGLPSLVQLRNARKLERR